MLRRLDLFLGRNNIPQFLNAARENDLDWINHYLSQYREQPAALLKAINVSDDKGHTALFLAAQNGHYGAAQLLLDHGADVHQASNLGATPFWIAANWGHLRVAKLLLAHGAKVDQPRTFDNATPLHSTGLTGHLKIARLLLDHGANVNAIANVDGRRYTPLAIAQANGKSNIAELIRHAIQNREKVNFLNAAMENDLDAINRYLSQYQEQPEAINVSNGEGHTALFLAAQNGHHEAAKLLLDHGADVNAIANVDGQPYTPLKIALANGKNNIAELIRHAIQKREKENFLNAAMENDLDGINRYLSQYQEQPEAINVSNGEGHTALFIAAQNGHHEAAKLLLDHGAEVNQASNLGNTPLDAAAYMGFLKVAQLLLAHGANVDQPRSFDKPTPLWYAAHEGHLKVAKLLLDHGADVKAIANANADRRPYTPLEIAQKNAHDDIVRLIRPILFPTFQARLERINFDVNNIPNTLCDPISLMIINDPLAVSTGITYDRESLIEMFKICMNPPHIVCPLTRMEIRSAELNNPSNVIIKGMLEEFVKAKEDAYYNEQKNNAVSSCGQGGVRKITSLPSLRAARLAFFEGKQANPMNEQGPRLSPE